VGDTPLLVPGIGAQRDNVAVTVAAEKTSVGGMMTNSSHAILLPKAIEGEDFTKAARRVAQQTQDEINLYR